VLNTNNECKARQNNGSTPSLPCRAPEFFLASGNIESAAFANVCALIQRSSLHPELEGHAGKVAGTIRRKAGLA
jgi:hypothetical protein